MDLSNFCARVKVSQYKVCAALNCVCSCPEGLDTKDNFLGGATNGNNESACITIDHTGRTEKASASMCSFEQAM